jgi:hypothetical protein
MAAVLKRSLGPSAAGEGSWVSRSIHPSRLRGGLCGAALVSLLCGACGSSVEQASGGDGSGGSTSGSTDAQTSTGAGGTMATGGAGGMGAGGAGGSVNADPCADPTTDVTSMDLGEIELGVSTQFPICNRTVGFTALATAPNPSDVLGIARLKPPIGGSVILNFAMADHSTTVFGRNGWIGAANPQSDSIDAFPVQEGTWRITLGDDDGSIAKAPVTVWSRRTLDGAFHGGVVDVNVFIAPNAASQSYVNAVVAAMFPYAGLALGKVAFFPLDSSYAVVGTIDEFIQLLQESEGVEAVPALNLFVIGDFGAQFGDAIGIAGGIPGSPMRHGTGMSGVAYQPSGNAEYDASVLRHETGHLAGLFHTTEYSIAETDPLSDTPECATSTMQSQPDSCPDVSNSMFPIAYGAVKFTPAQEIVIQGSMLYRGILQAGGAPVPPVPAPPVPGARELLPLGDDSPATLAALPKRGDAPLRKSAGSLERVLGGVWCSHNAGDYTALAVRIAGSSAAEKLRALALDEGAPEIVRRRALKAYVRAAGERPRDRAAALELATSFARDPGALTGLRIASVRALAEHGSDQTAILPILAASSEPNRLVRAVAAELAEGARP